MLLRPATNQTAFMKAGIMGFAGSGKSFTAKELAIGLAKLVADGKPVAFFDTETGSDFLIPAFREAGIELLVAKTRSFADLKTFVQEAEQAASVGIIDSVTHVWTDLVNSYRSKLKRRNGLLFQDWGPIKEEWGEFTKLYINSRCHLILCGRAGYEYDMAEDESGKKELIKTGTKMKAEGEMSYEPSLLLEMERVTDDHLERGKRSQWIHRCYVLKDRTNRMNGATIDNPTFEDFRPAVDFLNIGGEHIGVDASRNSQHLFDSPDSLYERKRRVEITLELIQDSLTEAKIGGTSAAAKEAWVREAKRAFGTSSWTAIQNMRLEDLEAGLRKLRQNLHLDETAAERSDRESSELTGKLEQSITDAGGARRPALVED